MIFVKNLEDVISGGIKTNAKVEIPLTRKYAESIVLDKIFVLFANWPSKDDRVIKGHACISMVGLFKQLCALGIPISYTAQNNPKITGHMSNSKIEGIHGTQAMNNLLRFMIQRNVQNKLTNLGFIILWSGGFMRC